MADTIFQKIQYDLIAEKDRTTHNKITQKNLEITLDFINYSKTENFITKQDVSQFLTLANKSVYTHELSDSVDINKLKILSTARLLDYYHRKNDPKAFDYFIKLKNHLNDKNINLELRCRLITHILPFLNFYQKNPDKSSFNIFSDNNEENNLSVEFVKSMMISVLEKIYDTSQISENSNTEYLNYIYTIYQLIPFYTQYKLDKGNNNGRHENPSLAYILPKIKNVIHLFLQKNSNFNNKLALLKLLSFCNQSHQEAYLIKKDIIDFLLGIEEIQLLEALDDDKKINLIKKSLQQKKQNLIKNTNILKEYLNTYTYELGHDKSKESLARKKMVEFIIESNLVSPALTDDLYKISSDTLIDYVQKYIKNLNQSLKFPLEKTSIASIDYQAYLSNLTFSEIIDEYPNSINDKDIKIHLQSLYQFGHMEDISVNNSTGEGGVKEKLINFQQKQVDFFSTRAHLVLMKFYDTYNNRSQGLFHQIAIEDALSLTDFDKIKLALRECIAYFPPINLLFDTSQNRIYSIVNKKLDVMIPQNVSISDKMFAETTLLLQSIFNNPERAVNAGLPETETDTQKIKTQAYKLINHLNQYQHFDNINIEQDITCKKLKDIIQQFRIPEQRKTVVEALWQQYQITSDKKTRIILERKLIEVLGLPTSTVTWFTKIKSLIPMNFLLMTRYFPFPLTETIASYFDSSKQRIKKAMLKQGYDAVDFEDEKIWSLPGTQWIFNVFAKVSEGYHWLIKKMGIGHAYYKDSNNTVARTKLDLLKEYKCICNLPNEYSAYDRQVMQFILYYFNRNKHFKDIHIIPHANSFSSPAFNEALHADISPRTKEIITHFNKQSNKYKTFYKNARSTLDVICKNYTFFPRGKTFFFNDKMFDVRFYNILRLLNKFGGIPYLKHLYEIYFKEDTLSNEEEYQQKINNFIQYVIDEVILTTPTYDYKKLGFSIPSQKLGTVLRALKQEVNRYGEIVKSKQAVRRTSEVKRLYFICDSLIRQLPYGPYRSEFENVINEEIEINSSSTALEEVNLLYQRIIQNLQVLGIPYFEEDNAKVGMPPYRRIYNKCYHLLPYFHGIVKPNDEPRKSLESDFRRCSPNVNLSTVQKLRNLHARLLTYYKKNNYYYYFNSYQYEKVKRQDIEFEKEDYRRRKSFWGKFSHLVSLLLSIGQASLNFYALAFGLAGLLGPLALPIAIIGFIGCLYTNYFLFYNPTFTTLNQLLIKKNWFNGFTSPEGKLFAVVGLGGAAVGMAVVMAILVCISVLAMPGFPPAIVLPIAAIISFTTFVGILALMYNALCNVTKGICNMLNRFFPEIEEQGWGIRGILKGIFLGVKRIHLNLVQPGVYSKQGGYINALSAKINRLVKYWKNPIAQGQDEILKMNIYQKLFLESKKLIRAGNLEEDAVIYIASCIYKHRDRKNNESIEDIKQKLQNRNKTLLNNEEEFTIAAKALAHFFYQNEKENLLQKELKKQIILKRIDMISRSILAPLFFAGAIVFLFFAVTSLLHAWHTELVAFLTNNFIYNISVATANLVGMIMVTCIGGIVQIIFQGNATLHLFGHIKNLVSNYIFNPMVTLISSFFSKQCNIAYQEMKKDIREWWYEKKQHYSTITQNFLKDPQRGIYHVLRECKKTIWDTAMVLINALGSAALIFKSHVIVEDINTGGTKNLPLSEIPLEGYVDTASSCVVASACTSKELIDNAMQDPENFIPNESLVAERQWILEKEKREIRNTLFNKINEEEVEENGANQTFQPLLTPPVRHKSKRLYETQEHNFTSDPTLNLLRNSQ